jgi:phosphoribosylformylglycinamidine (FGAM) synthase-like amidotransferase family enzyme
MTTFKFRPRVNDPMADVISTALGDNTGEFKTIDIGQAVKQGSDSTYVQVADGDEIEGVVVAVEGFTVNDGFSFGSVQRDRAVKAQVVAGGSQVAVLDMVVAGTPIALGTANGFPQVKKGAAASQAGTDPFAYTERTPNTHLWRVTSIISGNGSAGDYVLIERI